jgi:hypothetical protein
MRALRRMAFPGHFLLEPSILRVLSPGKIYALGVGTIGIRVAAEPALLILEEVPAGVRLVADLSVFSLPRQPYAREALIGDGFPGELGGREAFVRERPVVAERVAECADGRPLERG